MTIQEKFEKLLVDCMLWPNEAHTIIESAKNEKQFEAMKNRWRDNESGYPTQLFAVLSLSIRQYAIGWIDANKPKHFARNFLQ